jgi:hypothetical protein
VADKTGPARTPYLTRAFVNFLLGTALLFLINFGVGTLLLRSLWLGVGEILAGGLLALILVARIQKDDLPSEAAKAAPSGRVGGCELAKGG